MREDHGVGALAARTEALGALAWRTEALAKDSTKLSRRRRRSKCQSDDTTQPSTGVGAWRKEQDMQMTRVHLAAYLLPSTVSCAFHVLYTSVRSLYALEHGLVLVSSPGKHCRSSHTTCCARRVWATRCSTPATSAARTFLDFILT
jgi:hypothetical protein